MKRTLIVILTVTICTILLACASTKGVTIGHRQVTENMVEMWYDSDGDGKCDYKMTYVFEDGKLTPIERGDCSEF